jgi:hypothetical protein
MSLCYHPADQASQVPGSLRGIPYIVPGFEQKVHLFWWQESQHPRIGSQKVG